METTKELSTVDETKAKDLLNGSYLPESAKFELVKQLAKSSIVPKELRNNEANLYLVLSYSEMLDIPYALGVTELYVINDRICTGVHIGEGKLLSIPDISYEVVEDSEPIYYFRANGGITKIFSASELEIAIDPINGKYEIAPTDANGKIDKAQFNKNKLQISPIHPPYIPVDASGNPMCPDRRTTIRFIRKSKNIDKCTSYLLSEAFRAGLPQDKPYTWGKYEKDLMYARCFGRVSRRYGGDKMKNIIYREEMMTKEEMAYTEAEVLND